jgi:hypothetical protein
MLKREDEPTVRHAERRIQRILIELEEELGKRVEHVEVDTRNWAQLRTEITLTERPLR